MIALITLTFLIKGMVRVCSTDYEKPTDRNLNNITSHLTNYSLNKMTTTFDHADDPYDGGKGSKSNIHIHILSGLSGLSGLLGLSRS